MMYTYFHSLSVADSEKEFAKFCASLEVNFSKQNYNRNVIIGR